MDLGLGTAQFGMPYGITNVSGQVREEEVGRILLQAAKSRIAVLDTAPAYGFAEEVIGRATSHSRFKLVTKSPVFESGLSTDELVGSAEETFKRSLSRLGVTSVHAYLVHHAEDLLLPGRERLYEMMSMWRDSGRCETIGVSVYDARQIEAVIERFDVDIIQLPVNVFDQRLLADGTLEELERRKIAVHARSVFLQGVVLTDADSLPSNLVDLRQNAAMLADLAREAGKSRESLALSFVRSLPAVSTVIVGVTTEAEMRELVVAWQEATYTGSFMALACGNENLVNPMRWGSAA